MKHIGLSLPPSGEDYRRTEAVLRDLVPKTGHADGGAQGAHHRQRESALSATRTTRRI